MYLSYLITNVIYAYICTLLMNPESSLTGNPLLYYSGSSFKVVFDVSISEYMYVLFVCSIFNHDLHLYARYLHLFRLYFLKCICTASVPQCSMRRGTISLIFLIMTYLSIPVCFIGMRHIYKSLFVVK